MHRIGLLKELKSSERRVLLTPEGVKVLVKNGIEVFVEQYVGESCQFTGLQYEQAGATMVPTMEKVFQKCDLILQVSAPQPIEFELLSESHTMISFFNLYRKVDRLQALLDTRASLISLERIQDDTGEHPILNGMSEVTGRMVIYQAANLLSVYSGGKGKLLSGLEIIKPAVVTIIGAGTIGRTATEVALTNHVQVNLISLKAEKVDDLKSKYKNAEVYSFSNEVLSRVLPHTDVLIIAVHSLRNEYHIKIPREMIQLMQKGSVVIDTSLEQIAVLESSHVTTPEQPTYVVDGIVYYCVPNIPSLVPLTSSRILTKKILPFLKVLAQKGLKDALVEMSGLVPAISIYKGKITNRSFADYFGQEFYNIFELLELNL